MWFQTPATAGISGLTAMAASRREATPVSTLFFSRYNTESLHTSIRHQVYLRTGEVVDRQGDNQLATIMASVYDASQDPTIEAAVSTRATGDIVRTLNARVVARAVHEVVGAIAMHRHYMRDVSSPVPDPLPRSVFPDERTGNRNTYQ